KRGLTERRYPREHTLAWLSRVAAGLLRHDQTMFLIEDLQPSWLSGRSQRWAYVCGVSVVFGLLLGLVHTIYCTPLGEPVSNPVGWCTAIPCWLLMLGCVDNLGVGPGSVAVDRLQPGFRRAVAKMLASAACWLLLVAMLWPFVDQVLRVHLLWAGVVMVIWVGAKGANRSIYYCIEPVESLEWSLTWARQGMVQGLLSGLAVGGVIFLLISGPKFSRNGLSSWDGQLWDWGSADSWAD